VLALGQVERFPPEDAVLFARNYTYTQARENRILTRDFLHYMRLNAKSRFGLSKAEWSALFREAMHRDGCHTWLPPVLVDAADKPSIRSGLNGLQTALTLQQYRAGKLPPPVLEKYREGFEKWRKELIRNALEAERKAKAKRDE